MTEAFTNTLYSRAKRAVQFTKKPYLPLFLSETADKFAKDYAIKKASVVGGWSLVELVNGVCLVLVC